MFVEDLLGQGVYPLPIAARIIRVTNVASAATPAVRRWTVGYDYHKGGQEIHSAPILKRPAGMLDGDHYLTFLQLIEARMVGAFRDLGVSMSAIREAVSVLAEEYGTEHPFALRRLWTDGKKFYTDVLPKRLRDINMSDAQVLHKIMSGQMVFDIAKDFFLKNVDYDSDVAGRLWPFGHDRGIVIDPRRGFGRPIDAETGVSSYVLYAMHKGGTQVDDVAQWYGVRPQIVLASYEFELRMAA